MVEVIEARDWTTLKAAFIVDVGSLEALKKLAEGFNAPFIFQRKKEYLLFCGQMLAIPICYRYKK